MDEYERFVTVYNTVFILTLVLEITGLLISPALVIPSISAATVIFIASSLGGWFNFEAGVITLKMIAQYGIDREANPHARYLYEKSPFLFKWGAPLCMVFCGLGLGGAILVLGASINVFFIPMFLLLPIAFFVDYWHDRNVYKESSDERDGWVG